MSAAALLATTEQLALVTALRQSADDACASRSGMPAVLFEHEGQVLPDETHAARERGISRSEGSNMTRRVQRDQVVRIASGPFAFPRTGPRHAHPCREQSVAQLQTRVHP